MAQSIYRLNSFLSAFIKNWPPPSRRDDFPSSTKRCPISAEFNGPHFAYSLTRGTCRCRKYNRGSHGQHQTCLSPRPHPWESWPSLTSEGVPATSFLFWLQCLSLFPRWFSQFLVLHQQPFGFSVLGCYLATLGSGSLHPFVSGHGSLALLWSTCLF